MSRRGGPVPEPIGLKILKGNGRGLDVGGRPIPKVPAFERAEPDAPGWLSGEARILWDTIAPPLAVLDVLKPEDATALAMLCSAYGELVETTAILEAEGYTKTNPQSGHVGPHPLVAMRAAARRDVLRFAKEFGLTPSAEMDLTRPPSVPEVDEDDPFAAPSGYSS